VFIHSPDQITGYSNIQDSIGVICCNINIELSAHYNLMIRLLHFVRNDIVEVINC